MKTIRSWLTSLGLFKGRDRKEGPDLSHAHGAHLWEDPFYGAAVSVPIEDSLDLHTYPPDETGEVLDAYLEAARDAGHRRVRIIHGKGRGVQLRIVHSYLGRNCYVDRFQSASAEEGGWGATIVFLKPC